MILDFAKAENEVCDILGGHDPNWEHDRLLAEALERQAQAAVRKYGRHIDGVCDISVDTSNPLDSRCTCGLRELLEAK